MIRRIADLPKDRQRKIDQRRELLAQIERRFANKQGNPEEITDFIMNSGYTATDMRATTAAHRNSYRPAVDVYLTGEHPAIGHCLDSQAAYTDFKDTPAEPNIAVRQRALTEMMMRRITPSDLLLLQATHETARLGLDTTMDNVYKRFMKLNHVTQTTDFQTVLNCAAIFALHMFMGTSTDLSILLNNEFSRYYTGFELRYERYRREDNTYSTKVVTAGVDDIVRARQTVIYLLCIGIDSYAARLINSQQVYGMQSEYSKIFVDYSDTRLHISLEINYVTL